MEQFKIEGLSFSYPQSKGKSVLNDISLEIGRGEYVVLLGRSGCGKTTLLKHLKPLLAPRGKKSGRIYFNSLPIEEMNEREQVSKIGYVMQNPDDQIVTDKVWHELAFGLESLGCDQKSIRAAVAEMACYFGIQDWFHRKVTTLSGGQKQLLNLASVMVMHPEVLILDEPTSQLDPIAASDFLNTVRKINIELGTTVIISEHRLEDIFPYADKAVVMDKGSVIMADTPRNIGKLLHKSDSPMFSAMPSPVRVFFGSEGKGECPLTVREGRNWLSEYFKEPPKVKGKCGEEIAEVSSPALSFKEVWFRYEKNSADILRGVDLEIEKGTLHAIVGGNGAGKSTLLKSVCGICKPYRGKIKIFGKPFGKYKYSELFRNCLSMLPQDPKSLFVKKTVREELCEMTKDEAKVTEVADICAVSELMESHPYDLSGGEQQRVALAKVLLTAPQLLLLDEPTKGMDSFFKESFALVLEKLQKRGITVVMVSHDVEFCAKYAKRVSMFFDGHIITTNTAERFFGNNSFYTTAANRMSRHLFNNAVTTERVIELLKENREEEL